jgi:Domain of unknown function (DUF4337)
VTRSRDKPLDPGPDDYDRLKRVVALFIAASGAFVAICGVKDGNVVQSMERAQAEMVDLWALYRAKSTKQHVAEVMVDELAIERDLMTEMSPAGRLLLERRLTDYAAGVAIYGSEKEEIGRSIEALEREYAALNQRDDQFDMAEALGSLAIAVSGATVLTRKRALFVVAVVFLAFAVVLGASGFLGTNVHPNALARLLG